jgi:hypothetical protein
MEIFLDPLATTLTVSSVAGVAPGAEFDVPVDILSDEVLSVSAADLSFIYDPGLVEVVDVSNGVLSQSSLIAFNSSVSGVLRVSQAGIDSLSSASGTFLVLRFRALPSATGLLVIDLDENNSQLNEGLNGFVAIDGSVSFLDPSVPTLAIAATNAVLNEGNSGTTAFTFTVTRSGDTSSASSAAWAATGSSANPADASDFVGGVLPSGTVSFAAGQTSQTITVNVAGDTTVENNESFNVTLSSPTNASITTAAATGIIVNDDSTPGDGSIVILLGLKDNFQQIDAINPRPADGSIYIAAATQIPYLYSAEIDEWISVQGLTGATGLQGATGAPGPVGSTGATGPNGPSAYDVAFTNGFAGTEAEWLASLEGPQGIQGETGPTGATGPQGPVGPQGPQGPAGTGGGGTGGGGTGGGGTPGTPTEPPVTINITNGDGNVNVIVNSPTSSNSIDSSRFFIRGTENADELIATSGSRSIMEGGGSADTFVMSPEDVYSKQTADFVTDFSKAEGDKVALPSDAFAMSRIRFKAAENKRDAKSLFSKKHNLIYDMEKCYLYLDLNGKKQGLGGGGVLAQFEKGTMLEKDDFLLMGAQPMV